MEFSVFELGQNPLNDQALHSGTRTVVKLVMKIGLCREIGKNMVMLTTRQPWKEVKRQARAGKRDLVMYVPGFKYEHRIEPKLQTFGAGDTDWMLYVNGYISGERIEANV